MASGGHIRVVAKRCLNYYYFFVASLAAKRLAPTAGKVVTSTPDTLKKTVPATSATSTKTPTPAVKEEPVTPKTSEKKVVVKKEETKRAEKKDSVKTEG